MSHFMRTVIALLLFVSFLAVAPSVADAKPRQTTLRLDGLSLRMTAKKLRRLKALVNRVPGVRRARVDLASGELYVDHTSRMATRQLRRAATRAGFSPIEPTVTAKLASNVRPPS